MGLTHTIEVTERRVAANRRNAQKSTGPRTPEGKRRSSLNALRHGLCPEHFWQTMDDLGENLAEFDRLHHGLIASFHPTNALQMQLVNDLAHLWWRRARSERAQAGLQFGDVQREHRARMRELREVQRDNFELKEVAAVGLLKIRDSAAKFEQALDSLKLLIAWTERRTRDLKLDVEMAVRQLYGESPIWRGAMILEFVKELLAYERSHATQRQNSPTEATEQGLAMAAAARKRACTTRAILLNLLREEEVQVAAEYQLYIDEHLEDSPVMRDAALAPTDPRWTWILRQDNYLDRQIERKTRLLLTLRRESVRTRMKTGSRRRRRRQNRKTKDVKNGKTKPLSYRKQRIGDQKRTQNEAILRPNKPTFRANEASKTSRKSKGEGRKHKARTKMPT